MRRGGKSSLLSNGIPGTSVSGPTGIRAVIFRAQLVQRRPRSPWLFGSSGLPPAACGLALPGFLPPTRDTQDISGPWTPWRWVWLSQPRPGLTCWVLPATRWVAGLKQRTSVWPGKGPWIAPLCYHYVLGWHCGKAKQKPGR